MPGVRNVELILIATLVVSLPTLLQAFAGGVGAAALLIRLTLALALCWAGGAIVERVVDTYARETRRREMARHLGTLAEARARLAAEARAEQEQ
ncbi:MAG TPA: hypothetical protein VNF07_10170 [Acidimicrobiales bacterium]|nr:hypothetical protein [Acidimicrobiales bacterium]